jgi:O-antigen ligase
MFAGSLLTIPILIKNFSRSGDSISVDYLFVLALLFILILGFLLNFPTTNWLNFQAYSLMLVTYVYVKENTTANALRLFASVVRYFLLINGVFMALQLATGSFFPAQLFAAGDPPLIVASGVSDGPTKNGMLISFALSYMFAEYIFNRIRFTLLDNFIFLCGIASLFLASSRAGIFSFITVFVLGSIIALFRAMRKRNRKFRLFKLRFVAGFAFIISAVTLQDFMGQEGFYYYFQNSQADPYAFKLIQYKLSVFSDSSTEQRADAIEFALNQVFVSPLHIFSVGFGAGTFEQLYGLNVHNSYVELLFTTGLYGFLVFLIFGVRVVRRALARPDAFEIFPMLFSLMSIMVFMAAHDVLRGRIFWIALGFVSAFAYSNFGRDRNVLVKGVFSTGEDTSRHYRAK